MGKTLSSVLSALFVLALFAGGGVWWVRALSAASFSLALLPIVLLTRRFTRGFPNEPWACHVAAAIAITFGVSNVIAGGAHSFAVASLALRQPGYGPLQILRFTTGAMLLYSGVMGIALSRGIRAGRRPAIGVGIAAGLLFWVYLAFTFPLPGTGGTVPRELVLLTLYLVWLGAAALASWRGERTARSTMPRMTIELAEVRG
jgi:hypothetical protein